MEDLYEVQALRRRVHGDVSIRWVMGLVIFLVLFVILLVDLMPQPDKFWAKYKDVFH
jgi:hypothetical protein